jgi:hypothetical protein
MLHDSYNIDDIYIHAIDFPSGGPRCTLKVQKLHQASRHHIVMNKHCWQYIKYLSRMDHHTVFPGRRTHSEKFPPKPPVFSLYLLLLSCTFYIATMRCFITFVLLAWMVILLCEFNSAQVSI